jgi:hypothetical protein
MYILIIPAVYNAVWARAGQGKIIITGSFGIQKRNWTILGLK